MPNLLFAASIRQALLRRGRPTPTTLYRPALIREHDRQQETEMSTFAPSATEGRSNAIAPGSRPLLTFFALVFALSVPFSLVGAQTNLQLVEGLPVTTLMVFCPLIAASILVYREKGRAGLTSLLERAFDYRRIRAPQSRSRNKYFLFLSLMKAPTRLALAVGAFVWFGFASGLRLKILCLIIFLRNRRYFRERRALPWLTTH
jgi:hypothetical protein